MSSEKNWQFELEEYIRQGEPDQEEKSKVWQTAIGLQSVDGLKTSPYLFDTAKEHIEGRISIDEVQKRIQSYYEQRVDRLEMFFSNLIFGTEYELKNRYMHVEYVSQSGEEHVQSAKNSISKCKNCPLDELAILQIIVENPNITQKEIAERIEKLNYEYYKNYFQPYRRNRTHCRCGFV